MTTYRFKTKPYKHQWAATKKAVRSDFGLALLMDPRTGKTKAAIDYFGIMHLKEGLEKVLIVCPSRVIGVWIEEIHTHCPLMVDLIVWDRDGRKAIPKLPRETRYDLQIVIVNYEAFGIPGKKLPSGRRSKTTGRFKYRSTIARWLKGHDALCILDESHKIKSPSGKAAMMIVSMRPLFRWRLLLTGTVVTKANRAYDIYMQWKFLNPERFRDTPTLSEFKLEYGRFVDTGEFVKWVGGRNLEKLHRRIHQDSYAVHREDCFDLPPREDLIESVVIRGETARVYDDMAEQMVAELENGEITEASIALVKTLRLSQITGGTTNTIEGETYRIGSEKLLALKPHLQDAQERCEKLVIAARYKSDLDAIAALCDELGLPCWQLRGGIKRAQTDKNIRLFREYDDAGVFLMQPAAGALGIDLSTSAKMIWYSLVPSFVDFSQSCDRIALSRNSTTFIYFLAKGTIDEIMYQALQTDGDVAKAITSNPRKLLRSKHARAILKG